MTFLYIGVANEMVKNIILPKVTILFKECKEDGRSGHVCLSCQAAPVQFNSIYLYSAKSQQKSSPDTSHIEQV